MFLKAICKIRSLKEPVELILTLHFKTQGHISIGFISLILELVTLYNTTQFVNIT